MPENEQDTPKRKRVTPWKILQYGGIATAVIGFMTFQSCMNSVRQSTEEDQEFRAKFDALANALYEDVSTRLPEELDDSGDEEPERVPSELQMTDLELARSDRNALLDSLLQSAIADIQNVSCARTQHYLMLSEREAINIGITREQWLLNQLDQNIDALDDWVLSNGYAADAYHVAEARSRTGEVMAIAEAIKALYNQQNPSCDGDPHGTVITSSQFMREAQRVRQIITENIRQGEEQRTEVVRNGF